MNKRHKWYNEIVAWADGAAIEWRWAALIDGKYDNWRLFCKENKLSFYEEDIEYRIKPQPKEPQYLYVYKMAGEHGQQEFRLWDEKTSAPTYIGKIKLEVDDA